MIFTLLLPRLALRIWSVFRFWIDGVFKFNAILFSQSILLGLRGFAADFGGAPGKEFKFLCCNSLGRKGSIMTLYSWSIIW